VELIGKMSVQRRQALPIQRFLMFSVASWNIRGMNQSPKQNEVRQVIHDNKLSVCEILELHVTSSSLDRLCSKVFRHWSW
jgi:hypothetical protein